MEGKLTEQISILFKHFLLLSDFTVVEYAYGENSQKYETDMVSIQRIVLFKLW